MFNTQNEEDLELINFIISLVIPNLSHSSNNSFLDKLYNSILLIII
jgi:hypothetical protein